MVGFYNYTVWMTYVALASGVAGIFQLLRAILWLRLFV